MAAAGRRRRRGRRGTIQWAIPRNRSLGSLSRSVVGGHKFRLWYICGDLGRQRYWMALPHHREVSPPTAGTISVASQSLISLSLIMRTHYVPFFFRFSPTAPIINPPSKKRNKKPFVGALQKKKYIYIYIHTMVTGKGNLTHFQKVPEQLQHASLLFWEPE